jgi:hypothetical protein
MPASKYDFPIERGSSYKLSLKYKDNNDQPKDLTGWCARLIWTTNEGATQTFSTTNNDLSLYKFEIIGSEGHILLKIPATTTNLFTFETANYDLELESPNDIYVGGGKEIIRLLYGTIKIANRYSEQNTLLDCQP